MFPKRHYKQVDQKITVKSGLTNSETATGNNLQMDV